MIELIRIDDPVTLQMVSDALTERHITYQVENAGMNALLPVPDLMAARILVSADDEVAARQIMQDLELR